METSAISTGQNAASRASSKAAVSADFDTFLKMMTTQMKNQDPMNPIDSADYAVQLATFSGVEQQTRTNQLLEGLTSQFGVLGMAQLAAWVGQEARSAAPVYLGDEPISISYQPATQADRAVLVVKNAQGQMVSREDVSLEGGEYQWLGADAAGNPLPNGIYSLSLENYNGEQQLGDAVPVESYARILEARGGGNGPTLVLAGGVEVNATEITALRVP
ncbi:flagellar hook capping FlgD N-terminal domain-containing protein [Cypionkella sp.]|uniref:flagellar hook capping FlgD N-terminal domain-containing protein n=1 Tax=Cypionkella sp. TaxID=2811411 RepID=UPI002AB9BC6F|nr:flagellar hook capping FlgD N-terminal domain-containing protein [Cypionkella sp.]MDZ4276669.1 flagellar hook capping FlgD N-terminal domain-containing protein [Erythrobacter sp.]MDZ4392222.1 flagellar hook capping FlgD N-terminal domain-containing protein [Cypionkella sp.]